MGRVVTALLCAALAVGMAGCAGEPEQPDRTVPVETVETVDQTDEMFNESVDGAELYVFQMDVDVLTANDYCYRVNALGSPLEDGGFYRLIADVTYLNGGVAGYVDFPDIRNVHSCEEVSPLDIGLPTLGESASTLALIGDYADGDVLINSWSAKAVWKDGDWVYRYDDEVTMPDGRSALVRDGVSAEDAQAGADEGVLSCEDYFVLPA